MFLIRLEDNVLSSTPISEASPPRLIITVDESIDFRVNEPTIIELSSDSSVVIINDESVQDVLERLLFAESWDETTLDQINVKIDNDISWGHS